jgi:hypothetical protein
LAGSAFSLDGARPQAHGADELCTARHSADRRRRRRQSPDVTKATVTLKVYQQYTYEAEKRQALDLWAERLQAIIDGQGRRRASKFGLT